LLIESLARSVTVKMPMGEAVDVTGCTNTAGVSTAFTNLSAVLFDNSSTNLSVNVTSRLVVPCAAELGVTV
jgi:hypothetical protein